jgi:glycosyltransferase involved in cell wall biosynthesis
LLDSPPDLSNFYEQLAVLVVPLRYGGGTRLKILEAMAYGRPVVTTALGAEGIEFPRNAPFLLGETPTELSTHAAELLCNDREWNTRAKEGRRLVESAYNWDATLRPLMEAVAATA